MTSAIDPSVIGAGNVDKASVRLQLERARDEITAQQTLTTTQQATITTQQATITTQQATITAQQTSITTLQTNVTTLQTSKAPTPIVAAGIGQLVPIAVNGVSVSLSLPAGGTWAYIAWQSVAGSADTFNVAGVSAGGTVILGPSTGTLLGFAWRQT